MVLNVSHLVSPADLVRRWSARQGDDGLSRVMVHFPGIVELWIGLIKELVDQVDPAILVVDAISGVVLLNSLRVSLCNLNTTISIDCNPPVGLLQVVIEVDQPLLLSTLIRVLLMEPCFEVLELQLHSVRDYVLDMT